MTTDVVSQITGSTRDLRFRGSSERRKSAPRNGTHFLPPPQQLCVPAQQALSDAAVEVFPSDMVKHRRVSLTGMAVEIVQATRREKTEFHFEAPVHLLALFERGSRSEGETVVEGLPRSTLKAFGRKFIFVPAAHSYHDWQTPRTLTRAVYFYFDPGCLAMREVPLSPRLFFENAALWSTTSKMAALIESPQSFDWLYADALGVVLTHEIAHLAQGYTRIEVPVRGGLAPWQQRIIVEHIDEHLAEQASLATLSNLVHLSPYHFCRAFKQSFGMPPHRYHTKRRIERAKSLLAQVKPSVTEVGLSVGFNETSSFTSAFRKATGLTPTAYRRSLA